VSLTVCSVCLLLPILLGLLLSILQICYRPFCGRYCPPCVSVTAHSVYLLLSILLGLSLTILRVYYCPMCVSVTVHPAGLLLPNMCQLLSILCVSYCPFCGSVTVHTAGLLLPILFGHVVLIPVTLVPRITRTSTNGLPLGLNIHNTFACAPESARVPQNGAHRPSRCYELFVDFCIRVRCIYCGLLQKKWDRTVGSRIVETEEY
jgi:hypothetical protein